MRFKKSKRMLELSPAEATTKICAYQFRNKVSERRVATEN